MILIVFRFVIQLFPQQQFIIIYKNEKLSKEFIKRKIVTRQNKFILLVMPMRIQQFMQYSPNAKKVSSLII